MRVVVIVAPFAPLGMDTRGRFVLSSPRGKWDQETCAGYALQQYATGVPGTVHESDRMGIVEGSCEYRARGVCIWGKFVLSKNLGYKHWGSPSS